MNLQPYFPRNDWHNFFVLAQQQKIFQSIEAELLASKKRICPPIEQVFFAFDLCSFSQTRVIILGQDPYHGYQQANGLAFSVSPPHRLPPSLKNIYKEIAADTGITMPQKDVLTEWAKQGILLLNSALSVLENEPNSHAHIGWQPFTDAVIKHLSDKKQQLIFVLWGQFAQQKKIFIDTHKHFILEAPHPSPFSAHKGFFGCKHFSQINTHLQQHHQNPIQWNPLQQEPNLLFGNF